MRTCTVCAHPEREAVDEALTGGESGRDVARRFGLTEASVRRHRANHLETKETEKENVMDTEREGVPDAVPVPAEEDPRAVAERQLAAEREAEEERRIAELVREEEVRRAEERYQAEQEAARAAARAEVAGLADRRRVLGEQAEEKLSAALVVLEELLELDRRQRTIMSSRAGMEVPTAQMDELLRHRLGGLFGRRLSPTTPGDAWKGMSLAERDPLTRSR